MRTAYINKENRVVYIAAFEEDKIQADGKGKLRFGGSVYDAETGKWNHTLGVAAARTAEVSSAQDVQRSTEEVFAVDGAGLGLGDTYKPMDGAGMDADATASPEQKTLQEAIASKRVELAEVRKQVLDAQADEDEALLADLRPQRDRLKKELEVLEAEAKNA